MIVVDTSVWVDFLRGVETRQTGFVYSRLGEEEPLMIGDLILTEVLQGCRDDTDYRRTRSMMDRLIIEPMVGREIAVASANNYRKMRERGVTPRKTIDVLIATFCIERGHILLHADRDFDAMRDLLGLRTV